MHELDDENTLAKVIASLKEQLGVQDIKKIAVGNEFYIFKTAYKSGPVIIKVPKDRVFSNVNDTHIDSRVLLDQEFALMRHVTESGIEELPQPIKDIDAVGFGALVMSYAPSDNSKPDDFKLGKLLARIHSITPPDMRLSAQENMEIAELIPERLMRRWQELQRLVDDLPQLPRAENLKAKLEPIRDTRQLLHMDFRQANFRMQNGKVAALLDWSNALIGHPALELARVAETGETNQEFLKGYASIKKLPTVPPAAQTIFRLDSATMLALVFLSEEPNPERAPAAITRVRGLHNKLLEELKPTSLLLTED